MYFNHCVLSPILITCSPSGDTGENFDISVLVLDAKRDGTGCCDLPRECFDEGAAIVLQNGVLRENERIVIYVSLVS